MTEKPTANKPAATTETKIEQPLIAIFNEPAQIAEDVSCCLRVNSVIAKEGIYTFPAGPKGENRRCLWSRPELLKATRTARAAKITILDHPPAKVVTAQEEIYGVVEKPFFDRDRIRVTLSYDKDVTPADFLDKLRKAEAKEIPPLDVSMGFYYKEDSQPGEWHGQPYDLVMRNIVIDHVATGVWKGRCSSPSCGIGVASEPVDGFKFMTAAYYAESSTAAVVKKEEISQSSSTVEPVKTETPKVGPPKSTEIKIIKQGLKQPVDTNVATADLLNRNTSLLKLYQQNKIEQMKQQRCHPT